MLAQMAGYTLLTPPATSMGHKFTPGNPDKLALWLSANFHKADGWVIALDMLLYGGLVASRELGEPDNKIVKRLEILKQLKKASPDIFVSAFQSIRRLSITVQKSEDLKKWQEQHEQAGQDKNRQRNHKINMACLKEVEKGNLDLLLLLQEDARPKGPQIKEHKVLLTIIKEKKLGKKCLVTTGCDEGAAVLLARMICAQTKKKTTVNVIYSDEEGAQRIALYEDRSIEESVLGQINAVGAEVVSSPRQADFILMVWCPDREGRDLVFEHPVQENIQEIGIFAKEVSKYLGQKKKVVIADVSYANGADPEMTKVLMEKIKVADLQGYAALNTAANTVGYALAQGLLALDNKNFLFLRFLEDFVFQTSVRGQLNKYIRTELGGDIWNLKPRHVRLAEAYLEQKMPRRKLKYFLPWQRTFEIGIQGNVQ
jgi:hypothetical protein